MFPIHTILHPTDFSDLSKHAFHLACALARDHGARLIVLHVADPPPLAYAGVMTPPPPPDNRRQVLEQLNQVVAPQPEVRVEHRLEEGEAAAEIVRVARESQCDFVILGTHGRTGLGRLLMGSVAEQVVRRAPCPVITVKTPAAAPGQGQELAEATRGAFVTPQG